MKKAAFNDEQVEWICEISRGFGQSMEDLKMMLKIHLHKVIRGYKSSSMDNFRSIEQEDKKS